MFFGSLAFSPVVRTGGSVTVGYYNPPIRGVRTHFHANTLTFLSAIEPCKALMALNDDSLLIVNTMVSKMSLLTETRLSLAKPFSCFFPACFVKINEKSEICTYIECNLRTCEAAMGQPLKIANCKIVLRKAAAPNHTKRSLVELSVCTVTLVNPVEILNHVLNQGGSVTQPTRSVHLVGFVNP